MRGEARMTDDAEVPGGGCGRSVGPAYTALRDGIRRFVAARVAPANVDDVVQDVFVRMQESVGDLRDEERLAGWAFRVARSVVVDHHRALARSRAREDVEAEPDAAPVDEDDEGNVNAVVAGWLAPLLFLLPDEHEDAVRRVDVEGMSQREYAALAGISLSGAKSRVQRGRRMLAELVRACCDLELDARGNVIGYQRRCRST